MTGGARCVGCVGHEHRFGPMSDCDLLDCTCYQFRTEEPDVCPWCDGTGIVTSYDGRSLGSCDHKEFAHD